jgi:hypothetical protein
LNFEPFLILFIMKKVSVLLLALMCAGVVFGQQKVAVYVTGGENAGINKVLGDQLVAAFTNSGRYIAIERTSSFLAELGKEQNYQRTGAVDDNELSRLGKQFGVQLVCVAEVNDVFGQKYVSARLIDVESAEVINTSNANSTLSSMDELMKVTKDITTILTGETAKEKATKIAKGKADEEAKELAKKSAIEQAKAQGYYILDNLFVSVGITGAMTYDAAVKMAEDATIGGYTDWRLPTVGEAGIIYANKKKIWGQEHGNTPFQNNVWSSTACEGKKHHYSGGYETVCNKDTYMGTYVHTILVRDVRK